MLVQTTGPASVLDTLVHLLEQVQPWQGPCRPEVHQGLTLPEELGDTDPLVDQVFPLTIQFRDFLLEAHECIDPLEIPEDDEQAQCEKEQAGLDAYMRKVWIVEALTLAIHQVAHHQYRSDQQPKHYRNVPPVHDDERAATQRDLHGEDAIRVRLHSGFQVLETEAGKYATRAPTRARFGSAGLRVLHRLHTPPHHGSRFPKRMLLLLFQQLVPFDLDEFDLL
mmetsp:Transcript_123255/g.356085  ORF Transcript_123255/g.356085 Transcript_123255/m.356085 type:complete len:223 (+) Transcript_123255:425-1093(+)